jgi:hypothetical protein
MPGLRPGIHDERPRRGAEQYLSLLRGLMDCRVKPGNDAGRGFVFLSGTGPAATSKLAHHENKTSALQQYGKDPAG